MDAGGLEGFGQGHRWQDGGESARLDHSCLTHPFPLLRALQVCARENAPTRWRAPRTFNTRQTLWIQPHHRSAHPRMALMTSSTLATHAMRGNTKSIQVSCSCAVAPAQPSRATTQS
jgi:hypothetical protein